MTDHPYFTHAIVERDPFNDGTALLMLCAFDDGEEPTGPIRRGAVVAEMAWPDSQGPSSIAARVVAEDTMVRVASAWRFVAADRHGDHRFIAKVVAA